MSTSLSVSLVQLLTRWKTKRVRVFSIIKCKHTHRPSRMIKSAFRPLSAFREGRYHSESERIQVCCPHICNFVFWNNYLWLSQRNEFDNFITIFRVDDNILNIQCLCTKYHCRMTGYAVRGRVDPLAPFISPLTAQDLVVLSARIRPRRERSE